MRNSRSTALAAVAVLAAAVSGCVDEGNTPSEKEIPSASPTDSPTASPTDSPSGSPAGGAAGTVGTRSAEGLGTILTDAQGRTLYLFEADEDGKPTCTGKCADAWPPLTAEGKPKAAGKAKSGLLGTVEREDGGKQVTYNDHPLYRYAEDGKPGETKGQDLDDYGAEWYVLNTSGDKHEGEGAGKKPETDKERDGERDQDQPEDGGESREPHHDPDY
ncbi:hypothetical protein [Streptomyces sp. HNM0574]|uniref:COG4315 family predicted lipoprotein n=1 Tax=Streptomyces sp. HNM0574 TaxID=2714954 RepID=UPI00146DEC07|nr:hypothetical protein [Streptomyces sp. HNM0574]NLU68665.1 hypothetical protein [Streptomyces sp. HNM0574]